MYTSEMQALLNKFNTELQDKQTTYKWMTDRLMLLKNQLGSLEMNYMIFIRKVWKRGMDC